MCGLSTWSAIQSVNREQSVSFFVYIFPLLHIGYIVNQEVETNKY